ncbi:response regulator transcription factor [Fodinibius saliphilus]|uniref:response regulator transcription factor n=1 Tax=Fodinibius saliphilus TaxID=1920650 RepID=UPI0011093A52|nr:response regulator transcription factor [Fodinibius saliphilus]
MNILLLGPEGSITHTILEMLEPIEDWHTESHISENDVSALTIPQPGNTSYDIILVNLNGFSDSPRETVRNILSKFPDTPLLALNSYSKKLLIKPLLELGANGYIQVGASEEVIIEAVSKVVEGKQYIYTNST